MKMKKIVALVLAASMAFGCTACMQKGGEKGSGKKSNRKHVEVPEDPWAPYEEEVEVSQALYESLNIDWREGDDYDHNPWVDAFKRNFNIKLKSAWVSNDYDTKLNLSIADGDLPDIFACNAKQFQELKDADMIWDMTEAYEKYASDELKECMEAEPDTFNTAKGEDGKLYAIPKMHWGIIDQPTMVWIRKDWKEKSGMEDPKTMDDLINLARKFKEQNNSKFAISEDQNLNGLRILAEGFGEHPRLWVENEDGKIEYGYVQPGMKEVIKQYSEWYKEGLIDPDFPTKDWNQKNASMINGEVGIDPGYQYWGYNPGPDVVSANGPEAVFEAYETPSATGEPVKASIRFANLGYLVVSKDCPNPEALIKILNYTLDPEYLDDDEEIQKSLSENVYDNIPQIFVVNPNSDYAGFEEVSAALEKYRNGEEINPDDLEYSGKYISSVEFIENGTPGIVGDFCQMGSLKPAYGVTKELLDSGRYIKDKLWGLSPETWLNSSGTLNSILVEGYTKIIVGQEPIDYFDTIVEEWYSAGGEQATKEINEVYGNK